MKDGLQLFDANLNEVIKMIAFQQQQGLSQEQLISALQQQIMQQQAYLQQQLNFMSQVSESSTSTLEEQQHLPRQYAQRKFIIGGFGTNGYDSSSHAIEYLYDYLNNNEQFEFFEQVKQSWEDIDNYINDLQEEIHQNEKQGIETIYIHFAVNNTPFIRLEQCAYNNKAFVLPEMSCVPNEQASHNIDLNRPHNSTLNTKLSIDYIKTFLHSDNYWASESTNPGLNSNNYLYYRALQVTNQKSIMINLPSLLNENKESISLFLQDLMKSFN
ncbi:hypothetical protein ABPG72_003580 [Tetrahymena utriculariae]